MTPADTIAGGRGEVSAELLEALLTVRGEPAMTTKEVGNAVGTPETIASEMLQSLSGGSRVQCRAGPEGTRWWWVDGEIQSSP